MDCQDCPCSTLSANQRHLHNVELHGELNSNCMSLLRGLATQLKRELFYFTLPDSESEISSTTQFLLTFAAELKTMKKLEQLIGILQTKKERSNGKTELFSGKTIGW